MKKKLLYAFVFLLMQNALFAQDYALEFDGTESRVRLDSDATLDLLNGATDYTIEAWIKPTSTDIHNNAIIKRYYQFALTMYQDANKRVYFTHYSNANGFTYINSVNNVLNINQWNHIVVINNSTDNSLKLFVNGVDVTADSSGNSTTYNAMPLEADPDAANATYHPNFYAGYSGTSAIPFAYIDKIRVKTTAEDIATLQTSITDSNYTPDADTVILMNFDEGTGTTTVNEVDNAMANLQCVGNGCSVIPTWILVSNTVSVSENENISYSVYPNPTKGILTIKGQEALKNISILNILGKKVYSKKFENDNLNSTINLSNLNKGIYLIRLETISGIGVQKIVIK